MPLLTFEARPSDSPFVDRVWRSHSLRAGTFTSVAASHCELVVTRNRGRVRLTVRGPETRPTPADCPADAEWIGIRLSMGTWLPIYPAAAVRDRQDVDLPDAGRRAFRLDNTLWEYPTFDNAEVLVARLVRAGLLVRDPGVGAALAGDPQALSRSAVPAAPPSATSGWPPASRIAPTARSSAPATPPACCRTAPASARPCTWPATTIRPT